MIQYIFFLHPIRKSLIYYNLYYKKIYIPRSIRLHFNPPKLRWMTSQGKWSSSFVYAPCSYNENQFYPHFTKTVQESINFTKTPNSVVVSSALKCLSAIHLIWNVCDSVCGNRKKCNRKYILYTYIYSIPPEQWRCWCTEYPRDWWCVILIYGKRRFIKMNWGFCFLFFLHISPKTIKRKWKSDLFPRRIYNHLCSW